MRRFGQLWPQLPTQAVWWHFARYYCVASGTVSHADRMSVGAALRSAGPLCAVPRSPARALHCRGAVTAAPQAYSIGAKMHKMSTHVVYSGPDWNVNAEHGCVVGRSAHSLDSHLSGLRARYPSARAIAPTGAALSSTASVLASAASKRTSALIACCIIVPRVRRTRGTLSGRA